jgi:hypothetical protein
MANKALEWIFVTDALRAARADFRRDEAVRGAALQQARLLGEIAGRIAEPAEPLPPGNRTPIVVRLLRDGVALALTAGKPGGQAIAEGAAGAGPPVIEAPDLALTWNDTPDGVLRDAAEDPDQLSAVKATLLPGASPAAVSDEAVARTRAFLDRLLWNADAPRRRVEALLIQRWLRIIGALVVLAALVVGLRFAVRGKNVLEGKPFSVSSNWPGCVADPTCDGVLLFHTNNENEPWVIFDLQKPTTIHQIDVTNRQDSYQERALPLVAEVSIDRLHWKEVGRRAETFSTWTVAFPATSVRYIRLKVPRVTTLHLKAVEAR